jgi:hypothetical protein
MHLFLLVIFGFIVGAGAAVGICAAVVYMPGILAERKLAQRLEDVSFTGTDEPQADGGTVVKRLVDGPLPAVDRLMKGTNAGSWLTKVIEQSGTRTSPSAVILISVSAGLAAALVTKSRTRELHGHQCRGQLDAEAGRLLGRKGRSYAVEFFAEVNFLGHVLSNAAGPAAHLIEDRTATVDLRSNESRIAGHV